MMSNDSNNPMSDIRRLYNGLLFEEDSESSCGHCLNSKFGGKRRLSRFNKKEDISELLSLIKQVKQTQFMVLSMEDRELLEKVVKMRPLFVECLKLLDNSPENHTIPFRAISDVLDTMLLKGGNCETEQIRKKNTITKLLAVVGLTPADDYLKFHNVDTINAISKYIVSQTDAKGDLKRKHVRYIKEFATCGMNIDPEIYKMNVILNLPKIEKTKKSEKNLICLIVKSSFWKFLTRNVNISRIIQMHFGFA